jgi:hypothetical protein
MPSILHTCDPFYTPKLDPIGCLIDLVLLKIAYSLALTFDLTVALNIALNPCSYPYRCPLACPYLIFCSLKTGPEDVTFGAMLILMLPKLIPLSMVPGLKKLLVFMLILVLAVVTEDTLLMNSLPAA